MAAHLHMRCPQLRYTVVERRAELGGTWDLFRYPGIRSDSDMYTLGFGFEPWTDADAIASGDRILRYLNRVVDSYAIRTHIQTGTRVLSANFDTHEAVWHVVVEDRAGPRSLTARFFYLASGYYDYDSPNDPAFPGAETFGGQIVHPQFWPENFDYSGKKVIVIGSGATAVTMVPAMAERAAHVTMLQRTPTWMSAQPRRDRMARLAHRLLPPRLAHRLVRAKNVRLQAAVFKTARKYPAKVGSMLTRALRKALGSAYQASDWARLVATFAETGELIHPRHERRERTMSEVPELPLPYLEAPPVFADAPGGEPVLYPVPEGHDEEADPEPPPPPRAGSRRPPARRRLASAPRPAK